MNQELLISLFFTVALIYSMAGFGGGSSYIALLVLFAFPYQDIPVVGLICNVMVVSIGSYSFYKAGFLNLKLALPFAVTSVPMAFWAGGIKIDVKIFLFLLAASLFCAGLNMLLPLQSDSAQKESVQNRTLWFFGLPVGAFLGGLSGLVGIGGGIFLSPLLHLARWGHSKEIAATASLFILVNSLAGLLGRWHSSLFDAFKNPTLLILPFAVLCGGLIGTHLSCRRLSYAWVRRITATLVLYASFNLWTRAFAHL